MKLIVCVWGRGKKRTTARFAGLYRRTAVWYLKIPLSSLLGVMVLTVGEKP